MEIIGMGDNGVWVKRLIPDDKGDVDLRDLSWEEYRSLGFLKDSLYQQNVPELR